jgi:eukaryotic-like serine/threonine-protein kinase
MAITFPAKVGHYTIESVLGAGHIGFVYKATNTLTKQAVALKVLRMDSPVENARQYFENEAAVCAGLHHHSIPALYESIPGEIPALAFQYIDGRDGEVLLETLAEGEFFSVEKITAWGIQIAGALVYLHKQSPPIIFRDLKASHIMVDEDSRAWLVDYNLAIKLLPNTISIRAEAIGTEGFNPPEQYQGIVSPQVDIYALGATLHYLLTRIDPRKERLFTYAPPRSINPAVPKNLAQVIMRALAYEAEDRFPHMKAMQNALQKALASG